MNNRERLLQILSNKEDCLIVRNSSAEIIMEETISSIGTELGYKILSAYACNPNDLGCPVDYALRRGMTIGRSDRYIESKFPPMWANEAEQNPNTQYVLHLQYIEECSDEQIEEWKTFIETRTICGLNLENVIVCAEYVIYPGVKNPKQKPDDVNFFDAEIHWEFSSVELWNEIHEKLDGQVPHDFIALFENLQSYWESPLLLMKDRILKYQRIHNDSVEMFYDTDDDIKKELKGYLLPSIDLNSINGEFHELAKSVYEYISPGLTKK